VSTKTFRNATTQQKQICNSSAAFASKEMILSNVSKRRIGEGKLPQILRYFHSASRIGHRSRPFSCFGDVTSRALHTNWFFLLRAIPVAVLSYTHPSPPFLAAELTLYVLPIAAADAAGAWSNW